MYTILNNALVEVPKEKNDAGFEYLESYDTRIKVYEELENSLDGYKMYSDKAGNWGDYIKTAVTGTERKMKWIRALFGEDS